MEEGAEDRMRSRGTNEVGRGEPQARRLPHDEQHGEQFQYQHRGQEVATYVYPQQLEQWTRDHIAQFCRSKNIRQELCDAMWHSKITGQELSYCMRSMNGLDDLAETLQEHGALQRSTLKLSLKILQDCIEKIIRPGIQQAGITTRQPYMQQNERQQVVCYPNQMVPSRSQMVSQTRESMNYAQQTMRNVPQIESATSYQSIRTNKSFCEDCGQRLSGDAKFCGGCGRRL